MPAHVSEVAMNISGLGYVVQGEEGLRLELKEKS
jgi:hypothetical protein